MSATATRGETIPRSPDRRACRRPSQALHPEKRPLRQGRRVCLAIRGSCHRERPPPQTRPVLFTPVTPESSQIVRMAPRTPAPRFLAGGIRDEKGNRRSRSRGPRSLSPRRGNTRTPAPLQWTAPETVGCDPAVGSAFDGCKRLDSRFTHSHKVPAAPPLPPEPFGAQQPSWLVGVPGPRR